jgi:hypothetical protein
MRMTQALPSQQIFSQQLLFNPPSQMIPNTQNPLNVKDYQLPTQGKQDKKQFSLRFRNKSSIPSLKQSLLAKRTLKEKKIIQP